MCGRFILTAPQDIIASTFGPDDVPAIAPRYNVAPGQPLLAIRHDSERARRLATHLLWGLIPSWSKDPSIGRRLVNARAETVAEKPSFRAAFRRRRVLVPADGYYEWATTGARIKQPYLIRPRAGGLLALAGLAENWVGPDGSEIATCALLTTTPSGDVSFIHDRMPVIVPTTDYALWLDPCSPLDAVAALLGPSPDGSLAALAVSTRVNDARNEGRDLIAPLTAS